MTLLPKSVIHIHKCRNRYDITYEGIPYFRDGSRTSMEVAGLMDYDDHEETKTCNQLNETDLTQA